MTSIEREEMEAMACKAKVIRDVWLREREEARTLSISANAEVRRTWRESDNPADATSVMKKNSGDHRRGHNANRTR